MSSFIVSLPETNLTSQIYGLVLGTFLARQSLTGYGKCELRKEKCNCGVETCS